jgi:hypothetical protein
MPYTSSLPDFPRNLIVSAAANWFPPAVLAQICTSLRTIYFPIAEQRLQAYSQLSSLTCPAPFQYTPAVRFPADSAYASDFDPALSKLLSQLRTALSYKDRLLQTSSVGVNDRSISSQTPEYISALNSFQNALADLTSYTFDPSNYYDRFLFETTLSITWV